MKEKIIIVGNSALKEGWYGLKIRESIEKAIRRDKIRKRDNAIEFLNSFLLPGEESQYAGYTYSELLHSISLAVEVEKQRIKEGAE